VKRVFVIVVWLGVALLGAGAFGKIAFDRGEPLNATWFVVAAVCCYLVAYRLYSAFVAAKVLALDDTRATPCERHDDGRDFVPTNKWVLFGHHFAAIAGPGPLVGPTLAAQFGYLPGTLWLIAGAAFAGCVQDFVILFCSIRRDGKSLGQMAREEVSERGGFIAQLAVLAIMTILLAVIGLVVVNALKSSPWATFTLAMTIPIALLLGLYLRFVRPGRVLEASVMEWRSCYLSSLPGSGWPILPLVSRIHAERRSACLCHHRVWLRGIRFAGLVAARAARLSQRVHQGRRHFYSCRGHPIRPAASLNAAAHTLR